MIEQRHSPHKRRNRFFRPGEAWLHRHGKNTWHFESSDRYRDLVHITRAGNVYAILSDLYYGQPFWIGQRKDNIWIACQIKLQAQEIEFSGGGRYIFPTRRKGRA